MNIQTILVPLDGSAMSEQSLPLAVDLATKYHANLTLLRVANRPEVWSPQDAPEMESKLSELESACMKYLAKVQAGLLPSSLSIQLEYALGNPGDIIVERSKELTSAMIVMNSHGRDGLSRWLIGSVAEKVSRHAACPVLLVRQPQPK